MTNILIQDITYLTPSDVKDSSSLFDCKSDDDIKIIVSQAEMLIDKLVKSYWTKAVETQKTIFPTVDDWIPIRIQQACLLISEKILKDSSWDTNYVIKSEKRRWNTIVYDTNQTSSDYDSISKYIDETIYTLLEPYLNSSATSGNKTLFFKS